MKKLESISTIQSKMLFITICIALSFTSIFGQETKNQSDEMKGRDIFISQVKYSLNYIGLRLCEPIPNQEDFTIVYRLSFKEVSDKILKPIHQVLEQNNLKAGELVKFPGNRGFKYYVHYEKKHIGYLVVLNENNLTDNQKYIPIKVLKKQELKEEVSVAKIEKKATPIISEVKTATNTQRKKEPAKIETVKPESKKTVVKKQDYKNIEPINIANDTKITKKQKPTNPRIAIIIDDFGYSSSSTIQNFFNSKIALTISIIPGHKYSTWASNEANNAGKEVMIHMPMASDNYHLNNGESKYLLSDQSTEQEIVNRVVKACEVIPHARGMNNHMGSIATTQPIVVLPLIQALKLKNLYFVDSLTSPLSIMYENCLISNIPTARRRFFIDNERNKSAIIAELRRSIRFAKNYGDVIITGHTYSETLDALEYLIQNNEFNGIEICPVSELLR